jgi:hypothetical protein
MRKQPVLSRHRLPNLYRYSIITFWVAPIFVFALTIMVGRGFTTSLFDMRFLVPAAMMALPAFYIWQEGVDVLPNGIRARVHIPHYYDYSVLGTWYYDSRVQRRVLTVWDEESRKVLECRAGHLTDFPVLTASLKANVRWRNFPS